MLLPPGPRQPALLQVFQYTYRTDKFLRECARRYGDVFTMRAGQLGDLVLLSSPEHVKQVFTGDPELLHAGKANELLRPLVGPSSMLLLDGEAHLRQRRLLLPPLHGERMQAYADLMRDITDESIDRWPLGEPFALHGQTQSITLAVILRAVFGMKEGAEMADFTALLLRLFTPVPAIFSFLPALQKDFPGSPYRFWLRRRDAVDRALYALIAARRGAPDLDRRADVLSMLLCARDEAGEAMSDGELRDELITMLAAGHETTATMLSWVFERLLCHPGALARLTEEVQGVVGDRPLRADDLPRMEYLDAVVKETLRLRPVVPLVARKLQRPWTIGGYELPAGIMVAPCLYLVHRRPELYPDPEAFQPERWLGKKTDPYTWFPFGGGIRRCIGMAFALYEMKMVMAGILSRTELRLAGKGPLPIERRTVTLAPKGGTRVVLERRGPRRAAPGPGGKDPLPAASASSWA